MSSKVLDPTVPSASKSVARPANACNVCESVTRMDCTSDKPNRPKEHSGFGAQQWSCLPSMAWYYQAADAEHNMVLLLLLVLVPVILVVVVLVVLVVQVVLVPVLLVQLVLGSRAPWATTAVDWTMPVMEGQALKERADKN